MTLYVLVCQECGAVYHIYDCGCMVMDCEECGGVASVWADRVYEND